MTDEKFEFDDALVADGHEVKALEGGRIGGYLVVFSDENSPDLVGDFFTKDTDFGVHTTTPIYYHHGRDPKVGKRELAVGEIKKDEIGVWLEAQLDLRDKYQAMLYALAEQGKLGLSSGTAPHLVERVPLGKSWHIVKWPLGLDASLTPTPAEPRTFVYPLKSLDVVIPLESLVEGQEMPKEETKAVAQELPNTQKGDVKMTEQNEKAVSQPEIDYEKLAKKIAAIIDKPEAKAPAYIPSTRIGEPEAGKSLLKWLQGEPMHEVAAKSIGARIVGKNEISFGEMKAPLAESADATGDALVPNDFYAQIVAKRKQGSIARRVGARVITTSRDVVDVPVEGATMGEFAITSEAGAYVEDEPGFGKVSVPVYKFTKLIKVSEELLADDATNFDDYLIEEIGNALAATENHYLLTGTGSGQPQGALTGATLGITFASNADIAVTEVPELFWKLAEPYHDKAVWVMRGSTLGALQGKTGSNFQLVPTPASNTFDMQLWGKSVFMTDKIDAIGANKKSVLFGNFNYYALVERAGLNISRNPYLYQANGQVGIFVSVRFGGAVLQSEALVYGVHPA